MKCYACGGKNFAEERVSLSGGISAQAWKCRKCGEVVIEPQAAQKALLLNKLKRGVEITVGQLGSSLVMRFPAEVAELAGISKGSKVKIYPESPRRLVVTS
ncbi:MAG: AbrB/MazE/SpoVT family DNA-binding domain-containing protein [Candidatus Micrarchaeota archaeon]|mgnify:CR=1 FL=1